DDFADFVLDPGIGLAKFIGPLLHRSGGRHGNYDPSYCDCRIGMPISDRAARYMELDCIARAHTRTLRSHPLIYPYQSLLFSLSSLERRLARIRRLAKSSCSWAAGFSPAGFAAGRCCGIGRASSAPGDAVATAPSSVSKRRAARPWSIVCPTW